MFESWNKRRQRQGGDFAVWNPNRSWIDNVRRAPARPGAEHQESASPQQALTMPAEVASSTKDEPVDD